MVWIQVDCHPLTCLNLLSKPLSIPNRTKLNFWIRMLKDSELLLLNAQGFIPGPSESEEDFVKRVANLKEMLEGKEWIPRAHWDWVRNHLKGIFDFEPHSLPAYYSNQGLAFWQGAACWIEEGRVVSVQLKEGLRKGSYWGYSRSEILAHEAVHAARSAFDEPASEEFFAYLVSEKWWRRAFGPIVRRPLEVWGFFIAMVFGMVFPWANLAGALVVGAGFWRLMRQHHRMRRAGKNLMSAVSDRRVVRAILVRLTDREIDLFSKGVRIAAYADRQECLRWRLIRLAYL
jgi:hypothetical protein